MLTITWTNPPPIPQATPRPITRELDQAADLYARLPHPAAATLQVAS